MNPLVIVALIAFVVAIAVSSASFARNLNTKGSALAGDRGKKTQLLSFVLAGVCVIMFIVGMLINK